MRDPIYLTDADRSARSQQWKDLYCWALRVCIKNHWYIRWFVTREDRDAYAKDVARVADVVSKAFQIGSKF